ncbi:carboxypeptidase regulatory-like domain-containing protein [Candidatus Woesearchaeota archaeon]|nr:carboxypeptidase regulatory-like domain-containing protein [Candidatus Woesearchaeota archaeon]
MRSKLLVPIFVMIFLAAAVNAFVISGTVTDTNTNPIDGALIEILDTAGALFNSTTTNATGDYSVEAGGPILRTVKASAAGYDPQSTPLFVSADTVVNFALGPIQSVVLSGYVIDNASSPLNNVDIIVKQGGATFTQTVTNSAGFYSVNIIDGDSYDITASLVSYDSITSPITISGDTELNFTLTQTITCVDNDGDGYGDGCSAGPDFNDNDSDQYPGAPCSRTCYSGSTYDTSGNCIGGTYTCSGSSCFPAGTKILMENGDEKNIEDVKVGDKVLGFDGNEKDAVEVLELESPVRDHLYSLNFEDESRLELTREHPLYTEQGWKSLSPEETAVENSELKVQELKIGDKVLNSEGEYVEIISISFVEKEIQTYNLKRVSEYNNFFANGYLAHNKGGGSSYSGTDYEMDLDEGETITKDLKRRDTVAFEFEGDDHEVYINYVYASSVSVTVSSDPVTETIALYQTKGFNFNNNLANDFFIKVNSISDGIAEIEFRLAEPLDIPILPPAATIPEPEEPEVDVPRQSGNPIKIIVEDEDVIIEEDEEDEEESFFAGIGNFFKGILYLKYILAGILILAVLILVISLITRIKTVKKAAAVSSKKEELAKRLRELESQIKDLKKAI